MAEAVPLGVLRDDPRARLPHYAHPGDAGADLAALLPEDVDALTLQPGAYAVIGTGLRFLIPAGHEVQIRPRSGLAAKHGVTVLNSPGTLDETYRGLVGVVLINHGSDPFIVRTGDRIAQMVLAPVTRAGISEISSLDEATTRGTGGFGSTGQT